METEQSAGTPEERWGKVEGPYYTPSQLHLSPIGAKLIKAFESCRLEAYADSGGIYTIGWGSTRYLDGRPVKKGDKITQAEADDLFNATIPKFEGMVRSKIKRNLLPCEFDAAVSFAYNAGLSYKSGSQWRDYNIWSNINNRLIGDDMFKYWSALAITAGGKVLNGLVRRRKAECHLYLTGELNFFDNH